MYLDADISVKKKRYQKLLEKNKPTRPLYCITLPVNGENIMEIYSSVELWLRWYRKRRVTVIGLAGRKPKCLQHRSVLIQFAERVTSLPGLCVDILRISCKQQQDAGRRCADGSDHTGCV